MDKIRVRNKGLKYANEKLLNVKTRSVLKTDENTKFEIKIMKR